MPKLKNVTVEDLRKAEAETDESSQMLHDMADRIVKGYVDVIDKPIELARHFLSLSRSASDLAAALLTKAALQELERETRAMLEARLKAENHNHV